MMNLQPDKIPIELRNEQQWVHWEYEHLPGERKPRKVPYDPKTGNRASSTNPATWSSFDYAMAQSNGHGGIGYVFTGTRTGIDLDGCANAETGEITPEAKAIIDRFRQTYWEYSPSGTGVHGILDGSLPGKGNRRGSIEMYSTDRFFTVTGNHLPGTGLSVVSLEPELHKFHAEVFTDQAKREQSGAPPGGSSQLTDEQILAKARAAARGAKFTRLWDGDISGYESHSEADLALCGLLAFWARGDATQIDRIFRQSRLMRPKWDEKRGDTTYGSDTILKACEIVSEHYTPPAASSATSEDAASPDLLRFGLHDAGNADRIVTLYGNTMRYCHAFRKWLVWDGRRWVVDESGRAVQLAKLTMVEFFRRAAAAKNEKLESFAKNSLDARRLRSALELAQPELAVTPAELDTDPWLLNLLNGIVDLRTGELLPHDPQRLITKLVHYSFNPAAKCPTWTVFLYRIMGIEVAEDRAERMVHWLQKAIGYSLTGTTREKVVFICYGGGDNGKTTLLATIREVFAEYSSLIQIDSLMARREESNNVQADLADLRGTRFAMTSETEAGQRLAEAKLKRITQGMGRIKTARKYENPFEFNESHKLWMDANHKPVIKGTDNAIWNRLRLIPFDVVIPKEEQDRELGAKLLAEAEGVIAWVVSGAGRWLNEGLGQPLEVQNAGTEWRQESDRLGDFIEERCELIAGERSRARDLHKLYVTWCEENSEKAESQTEFTLRMVERGFARSRTKRGVELHGIVIRHDG